jgi:glycosyltransferase involved in cell wall biosynthesis
MRGPLKVAHVVLSLDVGGLERNVVNQVREGRALGQSVSVVCLERPGVLAPRVEALGGRVVCLDKRPGVRLSLFGKLRSLLRADRPDVLHTHQIPTLFYAGLAARLAGRVRVVHTEHGLPLFAGRARTRWLGRLAGVHCDYFFCLTREMADEARKYRIVPARKIRLIRNGIETANYRESGDPHALRRRLGIPPGAEVVGSVGRLAEIKRYDVLIRSFARLKEQCPDAHLLVVGDGPEKPALERLAGGLGLEKSVHFAGYQTNVSEYLHAMNCFAMTSSSEGTPQAVLEASVARLPVVASRVGGLPEIIDDRRTGILFPPGDEGTLTRELLGVLRDKELARRLGDAASSRVQAMYGVARMAREYHDCFLQLTTARS